ncbi:MAG TPA: 30S ribosomal protein S16, partial [Candidatus Saccharimonadales bacterium]|nr:30S ribosomal protein S16 [Candidatus Saccharimonadales bacterium]
MQRTGRKGHAMFRVVVQDSRRTPTSGKVIANLGSYDPHAKTVKLDKEKTQFYLDHGAQPSDRVAKLAAAEGIKLPKWVNQSAAKQSAIRNPEKLRRNRPAEEAPAEEPAAEAAEPAEEAEAPAETEAPAEAAAEAEAPAEEA